MPMCKETLFDGGFYMYGPAASESYETDFVSSNEWKHSSFKTCVRHAVDRIKVLAVVYLHVISGV